jgi:hypothetical protein
MVSFSIEVSCHLSSSFRKQYSLRTRDEGSKRKAWKMKGKTKCDKEHETKKVGDLEKNDDRRKK